MALAEVIRFVSGEDDIGRCQALRTEVFVDEQGVPVEEELDGRDGDAAHILATIGDEAAAAARVRRLGEVAKIERVCVARQFRGTGLGRRLMLEIIGHVSDEPGTRAVKLGSQISATGFYRKLGFEPRGPEYMDAGIPHVDMVLALPETAEVRP